MKRYNSIIIGFGKGGKTLAGALAAKGETVAFIEQSDKMYGGTCINVGCIPSKSLIKNAAVSQKHGGSFEEKASRYARAVNIKNELTQKLRAKNLSAVSEAKGSEVFTGKASLKSAREVEVKTKDGALCLYGDKIFINTGARPFIPPIKGIADSKRVYVSETLMSENRLPKRLTIVGGGYIGLEFASMYSDFGSQVTVVQNENVFLPREDTEIAEAVKQRLQAMGVRLILGAKIREISDDASQTQVKIENNGKEECLPSDAVLIATGRRPNIEGLGLENAGIETVRGAIKCDEHLRTSVPGIWAMGDVTGGLQFTYLSLDDYRIVMSDLFDGGKRTTENRGAIPYSVFLRPPFSRVGLSEAEAIQKGYQVKVARMQVASIPRAQVLDEPDGILKAVVDASTGKILGAHLFCSESHETINLIKLAMDAEIPYTVLANQIYTHPTMSESLNQLFGMIH